MNPLDQKHELERFLSASLHYYNEGYEPSYSNRDYNRQSPLFEKIGLSEFKVGEINHPLEAGYSKFWLNRDKARGHWNKKITDYVGRFFNKYHPRENK